jgi:2-polyprenyl-3-methyl-5-hydroxy-6-metoxy-1,4-benzoquinol methylase
MKNIDNKYYQIARGDISRLVPYECKTILEIGCGFGALGEILKSRDGVVVDGIEINQNAPQFLLKNYRQFWIGSVENLILPNHLEHYDCIIFPDVLEHLIDPWAVFATYLEYLKPGGFVVASIPNIRNLAIIIRLVVSGRWDYQGAGILDKTHLRFFTRKSITEMFEHEDLKIEKIHVNKDNFSWLKKLLTALPNAIIPDLGVCQFLVVAKKDQK